MSNHARSLVWKLVLPVPIALTLMIAAGWYFIPQWIAGNAVDAAIASGAETVAQFKAIRGYYTKNVIAKVKANGAIKPAIKHKGVPNTVPLPATFVHDLSELMEERDTKVHLYSAYPFPNRSVRKLDEFQTEAWEALNANPDAIYSRRVTVDGSDVVRVAMADKMVAKGCVNCHNSHPNTPKADWNLGDVRGVLEVDMNIDNQVAAGNALGNRITLFAAVAAAVVAFMALFAARAVALPIRQMTNAMGQLAKNDLTIEVPAVENKDEIGEMARTVQVFKDNMIKSEELTVAQKKEDELKEVRRARMEELVAAFEGDVGDAMQVVDSTVAQMHSSSTTMSSTADQTNERSAAVAAAAEEAATNVQTVATAAKELTSSIGEISRQMAASSARSQDAVGEVASATQQVQSLAEAAQSIGDVITLINDIANQTNLLALNATIEAARAGEAGKGFAVVASEVKNLATQTSKATEEIASQISGIQTATEGSVAAIGSINAVIEEINSIATSVASAVEKQGAATDEIARSVEQAASGTQDVTKNITDVSTAAGETGAAAEQVAAASEQMKAQADRLRQQVETFLADVQAA